MPNTKNEQDWSILDPWSQQLSVVTRPRFPPPPQAKPGGFGLFRAGVRGGVPQVEPGSLVGTPLESLGEVRGANAPLVGPPASLANPTPIDPNALRVASLIGGAAAGTTAPPLPRTAYDRATMPEEWRGVSDMMNLPGPMPAFPRDVFSQMPPALQRRVVQGQNAQPSAPVIRGPNGAVVVPGAPQTAPVPSAPANPLQAWIGELQQQYRSGEHPLPAGMEGIPYDASALQMGAASRGNLAQTIAGLLEIEQRGETARLQFDPARMNQDRLIGFAAQAVGAGHGLEESIRMATEVSRALGGRANTPTGTDTVTPAQSGTQARQRIEAELAPLTMVPRVPGTPANVPRPRVPVSAFIDLVPQRMLEDPEQLAAVIEFANQTYPAGQGEGAAPGFLDWWSATTPATNSVEQATQEGPRRRLQDAINRHLPGTVAPTNTMYRNLMEAWGTSMPSMYIHRPGRGFFPNPMQGPQSPLDYFNPGGGQYRPPLDLSALAARLRQVRTTPVQAR